MKQRCYLIHSGVPQAGQSCLASIVLPDASSDGGLHFRQNLGHLRRKGGQNEVHFCPLGHGRWLLSGTHHVLKHKQHYGSCHLSQEDDQYDDEEL